MHREGGMASYPLSPKITLSRLRLDSEQKIAHTPLFFTLVAFADAYADNRVGYMNCALTPQSMSIHIMQWCVYVFDTTVGDSAVVATFVTSTTFITTVHNTVHSNDSITHAHHFL